MFFKFISLVCRMHVNASIFILSRARVRFQFAYFQFELKVVFFSSHLLDFRIVFLSTFGLSFLDVVEQIFVLLFWCCCYHISIDDDDAAADELNWAY